MNDLNNLLSFCEKNSVKCETDVSGSDISSFRIGGKIPVTLYPSSAEEVSCLVRFMKENDIRFVPFGRCSNVVLPDDGIDFTVLKTDELSCLDLSEEGIVCGAGVSISKAASFAQKNGLSGMECLFGIPGSIGGGIYMNAGAYGGEFSQIVIETEFVDYNGNIRTVCGEDHLFGYRKSVFQSENCIITKTGLRLEKDDPSVILEKMNGFMNRRKASQPLEFPSAGSVFKRPEGYFAGKLIEDSGLKGLSVGGACVSEKHAGFIVNKGGATASDVKNLVEKIRSTVNEKFGVMLETEIKFY